MPSRDTLRNPKLGKLLVLPDRLNPEELTRNIQNHMNGLHLFSQQILCDLGSDQKVPCVLVRLHGEQALPPAANNASVEDINTE